MISREIPPLSPGGSLVLRMSRGREGRNTDQKRV